MVKHAQGIGADVCPHIDQNDQRCGHRFSLGRLDQAFSVCFGAYHGCPMYHRLNAEASALRRARQAEPALITVTAHGQPVALRPTGT